MAKSEEEKAKAGANPPELSDEERIAQEKEMAELEAESKRIEEEKAKKDEEKKKARLEKESTPESDKMFSRQEVLDLIKKAVADARKQEDMGPESMDDDDPYKQKKVRLPRFQNKFIFAFENTNTDEYFPDTVIHAFDIWNDQTKRNDPWVKVVFEDGKTLSVPLYTVIAKSQKVWVDLVEVMSEDTSYVAGKVERAEIKDYSRTGTGSFVKAKVTQADYKYKLRLPDGKEIIVGGEVINW